MEIQMYLKHMKRCSRALKVRDAIFNFHSAEVRSLIAHCVVVRRGETDILTGCCWSVNFVNFYSLSGGQFINISQNYKGSI